MTTAELLRRAAGAMSDGEDPFGTSFLTQNGVSLDQCFEMADQLAIGARMVAKALDDPRSPLAQEYFLTMAGI